MTAPVRDDVASARRIRNWFLFAAICETVVLFIEVKHRHGLVPLSGYSLAAAILWMNVLIHHRNVRRFLSTESPRTTHSAG